MALLLVVASAACNAKARCGAGDLDGDGRADVLIGSPYNDAGGNDAGAAYLVYGGGF